MQLLAISHRKAGTVITCPTCLGQVWVPGESRPEEAAGDEIDVELVPTPPNTEVRSWLALNARRIRTLLLLVALLLVLLFGVGFWLGRSFRP